MFSLQDVFYLFILLSKALSEAKRWVNTLNCAAGPSAAMTGYFWFFLLSHEHFRAQFDPSAQVLPSLNLREKVKSQHQPQPM